MSLNNLNEGHSFFPLLRERVRISFTDNKGAGRLGTWEGNRRVYQTPPDLLLLHLGIDNDDDDNDNNDDEAEGECGFEKVQRRRKFCETALKHFLYSLQPQQLVLFFFLVHSEII